VWCSDFSPHATGFSQWLMTKFLSAEFIRRKTLEGASPDAPNFLAVREHCPPENSLLATRCFKGDGLQNLPAVVTIFWLGDA
jgi:hypothetical protein